MNITRLIIIILLASFLLTFCSKTEKQPAGNSRTEYPQSELYNTTIIFTVKGVRNTVVHSAYIAKYSDKKETFSKELKADFYDKSGKHTSFLTADSGWIDEANQKMEVLGNVVVVNDDSAKLETESLKWDPNIDKIVTDDFVKITRGGDVITGYGLQTDQRLSKIKILKDVKGKVKDIEEKGKNG